jgi:protein-S-isoprenylcysteine O-methyltransferase Ste14
MIDALAATPLPDRLASPKERTMTAADSRGPPPERLNRRRLFLSVLATPLFLALALFLPAGTWRWPKGWLFVLVMVATGTLSFTYLWRVNPELVVARVNPHRGTKRWDKVLLGFFFVAVLAICLVSALDDGRFHWSGVPWWVCALGYALYLAGTAAITWAQAVNKFFEPTVRIQTDRGHTVVDAGPYALVRHPGYAAAAVLFVGMALALGSLWALIPAGLSVLLLLLRTRWEDQTLQAELPGYEEYARRVRYRWISGVW